MSRKLRTWAELVALSPSHEGAVALLRGVRKARAKLITATLFLEELRVALEKRLAEHARADARHNIEAIFERFRTGHPRPVPRRPWVHGRGFSMLVIDDPIRAKEDDAPDMH